MLASWEISILKLCIQTVTRVTDADPRLGAQFLDADIGNQDAQEAEARMVRVGHMGAEF